LLLDEEDGAQGGFKTWLERAIERVKAANTSVASEKILRAESAADR
jgi:hypothetical protein